MFKRHGNSVSLDKIAQEAGVGVATLYRNFPDREAPQNAAILQRTVQEKQQVRAGILRRNDGVLALLALRAA